MTFDELVFSADIEARIKERIDEWGTMILAFIAAKNLDLPEQWDPLPDDRR